MHITGLLVTYDDSTRAFLDDNKGLKYVLTIYVHVPGDTAKPKVALQSEGLAPGSTPLILDPDQVLFELNKQIFGSPEGFSVLVDALKNPSLLEIEVIAELRLLEKLKRGGNLKLNMVVTVAGKI